MFAPYRTQANAYSNVHMETSVEAADPHRLVSLLLDGALSAIAAAQGAMASRDIAAKSRAIGRAVGIVEDGLRGSLDLKAGGEVAATLYDLYSCVLVRLTEAHAKNDVALLRECTTLLMPLRDAWDSIKPQAMAA